jgi:hypothetical protein
VLTNGPTSSMRSASRTGRDGRSRCWHCSNRRRRICAAWPDGGRARRLEGTLTAPRRPTRRCWR